jgi:alkylation response protein AidB-like acyl-CoA dehydrogenase
LPAEDCQIHDNWQVTGLRGTGSRDFSVADVFVPAERTLPRSYPVPRSHPGALYAFGTGAPSPADSPSFRTSPWITFGPIGFSAVLLGIARGALDAFVDLAAVKYPNRSTTLLRDDGVVQDQIGRAEATFRSARAFLLETVRETWHAVLRTGLLTASEHKLLDLAGTHAAVLAAQVVDSVWHAAGTSSIVDGSPLERRFRDVHVGRQNVAVSPANYEIAGRLFLQCEALTSAR